MKTIEMLKNLEDEQFVSREDAAKLAKAAISEFTRRTKEGKELQRKVWDMALAGGCPNAVYNAAEKLAERYGQTI